MRLREGSLFTGYNGLGMAAEVVLDCEPVWFVEHEPATEKNPKPTQAAARLLAHRYPNVPNLGDITAVEWAQVEPVDVLTGGFPCQDVSAAGKRAGMQPGTRSGLWSHMAHVVAVLRPRLVLVENVRGLLSAPADSDVEPCPWCLGDPGDEPHVRALGAVLGDLAELGYDAVWCGLPASEVGAPHSRFRVFVAATDTAYVGHERAGAARDRWAGSADGRVTATHPDGDGFEGEPQHHLGPQGGLAAPRRDDVDRCGGAAADTDGEGSQRTELAAGLDLPTRGATPDTSGDGWHEGRSEPEGVKWGPDAAVGGGGAEPYMCGTEFTCLAAQSDSGGRRGDESDEGRGTVEREAADRHRAGGAPVADTEGGHVTLQPQVDGGEPTVVRPVPGAGGGTGAGDSAAGVQGLERGSRLEWGPYEPAIRRWERILGRSAPVPTVTGARGGRVLNPALPEWMMGLPAGWITDVPGLSRSDQLKLAGNGVVPMQAVAAFRYLLPLLFESEAAA